MVNLVITGKAVSNTFDNTIEIDTGGAKKVFLNISYNHTVLIYGDYKWSAVKPKSKQSF